jgi:Concanavalin A-like lectin/glucanases superfamily
LREVIALAAVLLLGGSGSARANGWQGSGLGATPSLSLAVAVVLALLPLLRRRTSAAAVLVLLASLASPRTSSAIVCTFQGTGGSGTVAWSNAGRWNQGGSGGNATCPPGPNDSAVYNTGSRVQEVDTNVYVGSVSLTSGFTGSLYLDPGKTLTVVGTWNQGGGIFGQNAGVYTATTGQITIGGSFILSGGTSSTLMNVAGAFTATGGTFMHNGGTVMLSSPTSQTFASNAATFSTLAIDDGDLVTGNGLVGYWKLDEASGTTFADTSASANSGTLHNSQTWVTPTSASSLPGLSFTDPAGLSFDGSSNYGTMGTTNLPALNASMTIALWAYYTSIDSSNRNAFALKSGSAAVQIGQRGSALVASKSGGVILATASSTPASGWHHLAYTFDGTTHRLYLDGGTATTSTVAPDTGAPTSVWIGTYNGGSELWAGSLDDVRIYSRVLGATEIAALAAGNQVGTSLATQTLTGNPTVLGDLLITRGTLAAGNAAITVANNWSNSGGAFTTGTTGGVTFNGSASGNAILAGAAARSRSAAPRS